MSLASRILDLASAVGADIKQLRTSISGSVSGSLDALSTTDKSSLVSALNEVKSKSMSKVVNVVAEPSTSSFWGSASIGYLTGGNSPTLLETWYTGGPKVGNLASFWLNENGAPRAAMPKPSDSALKLVGWGTGQVGPTLSVQQRSGDGIGGRSSQWGIGANGNPVIGPNEIEGVHCILISATDTAPPNGTPAGTIVFKRRS